MLKIGILTYHFTINFGATLQAYALYKILQDKGYEVEFIDYRPKQSRIRNFKYLYLSRFYLPSPYFIKGAIKSLKIRQFRLSHMGLSKKRYLTPEDLQKGSHDYDIVICGSDEIWNFNTNNSSITLDLSYFLNFISNKKTRKISYAASFGSTKNLGNNQEILEKLLKDFDSISVRDNNSLKLLSDCQIKSRKVLDPTFLVDFTKIMKVPKLQNKYILVYGALNKDEGNYVQSIADSKGLDLISIGAKPGQWKPRHNFMAVSPEEWIGYFFRSSYVFTSFYHGVIFSIIFKKPFTVFYRLEKSVKTEDLLKDLKIENRIVRRNQIKDLKPELEEISFDSSAIESRIKKSLQYLDDSVNN